VPTIDQLITIIRDLGFPIAMTLILIFEIARKLEKLNQNITHLSARLLDGGLKLRLQGPRRRGR